MDAITQLVAPLKTATSPMPAHSAMGKGINQINIFPKVAPIKNKGVTSPPLKPALKVKLVKINLMAKSNWPALFINASWIVGIPNPMNFVLLNTTINNAIIIPPIKKGQIKI